MITFFIFVVAAFGLFYLFLQQAVFGKEPTGEDLVKVSKSGNYQQGLFRNVEPTETLLKSTSRMQLLVDFFNKPKDTTPSGAIPSVKTNLRDLPNQDVVIVWFGHSSYLIKSRGFTILVDPVFSGHASPVWFAGKAFTGANVFDVEDLPPIDLLVITHDHYDHLDYQTIRKLHTDVQHIIAPMGVGSHLRHWQVAPEKITELNWHESSFVLDRVQITALPARHFSGRKFTQGKTLWASYAVKIDGNSLFLGGDSGYDGQFRKTGEQYGPFDIAFLEAGQYGKDWPYIHMRPEETVLAALELKAKVLMPVHWGKFALAYHSWTEPIERVGKEAAVKGVKITTPKIGEVVVLNSSYPATRWWAI